MGEDAARAALNVPRETLDRLDCFVELLKEENNLQNLVSKASLLFVWQRHILDSAQLTDFTPEGAGTWLDIGSGPGFPGLITSLLFSGTTTLVEPRKLRVDFLRRAAEMLGITDRVQILGSKVEALPSARFDVISARAFAPLPELFSATTRLAGEKTRWILPKGKNAKSELEAAESLWQGDFYLEPSRTDPEAWIVIAERVRSRSRGTRGR